MTAISRQQAHLQQANGYQNKYIALELNDMTYGIKTKNHFDKSCKLSAKEMLNSLDKIASELNLYIFSPNDNKSSFGPQAGLKEIKKASQYILNSYLLKKQHSGLFTRLRGVVCDALSRLVNRPTYEQELKALNEKIQQTFF